MQRDYGHGGSYGMDGNDRYGPYESYDSRSSLGGRDLMRSGYGYNESEQSRFTDSFDEGYDNFGGRNQGGSSWDAPYSRPNMRTGFMNDRGRGSYSSFSSFPSSLMKPAPAGLRGRGMPAYPEGAFGGRGRGFRGPSTGRGRGRGQMGAFRGMSMQGINMQSRGGAMGRGMKRKLNQAAERQVEFAGKKAKIAKQSGAFNAIGNKRAVAAKPEVNDEEEEKRKIEARREKQKRRREKNNEKMAYTCSFCKYRSFEEKDIEAHLESAVHKETLEHIQKQTKFEEKIMEFLHECMVNKYKKTSLRKAQNLEAATIAQRNMMEGITDEDHMVKVETVHCSACNIYIPALYSSVQQHFKSPEHAKGKSVFKEQVKRESILTATSILNNPVVKERFERFAKGENPFEDPVSEEVADENEEQQSSEQIDFAEDAAVDFTEDTANFVEDVEDVEDVENVENDVENVTETAETAELAEDAAEFAEDCTDQIDFTADYVTSEEN